MFLVSSFFHQGKASGSQYVIISMGTWSRKGQRNSMCTYRTFGRGGQGEREVERYGWREGEREVERYGWREGERY